MLNRNLPLDNSRTQASIEQYDYSPSPANVTPMKQAYSVANNLASAPQRRNQGFINVQTLEDSTADVKKLLPRVSISTSKQSDTVSRNTLHTQTERADNPFGKKRPPEVDPKLVTRQMLLNSHVYRKRNNNVTPLASDRSKKFAGAGFGSPRRTQPKFNKHLPAQIMDS